MVRKNVIFSPNSYFLSKWPPLTLIVPVESLQKNEKKNHDLANPFFLQMLKIATVFVGIFSVWLSLQLTVHKLQLKAGNNWKFPILAYFHHYTAQWCVIYKLKKLKMDMRFENTFMKFKCFWATIIYFNFATNCHSFHKMTFFFLILMILAHF